MYRFRMSIGDWSDDGHGKHEDFIVESNEPVKIVREAHYKIESATGINIEELCSEYEEDEIGEDIVQELKGLGFQFENSTGMGDGIMSVPEMAELWIFLLQKADPGLTLEIVDDDIPTLHFYGFDDKGRHISGVGYGLFS